MKLKKLNPKTNFKIFDSKLLHKIFILFACFCITLFIVISGAAPEKYDLKVDEPSPVDILAPRDMVDKLTTERLRDEAEGKITPFYELDDDITKHSQGKIYDFLSDIHLVRGMDGLTFNARVKKIEEITEFKLSEENLSALIQMSDSEIAQMQIILQNIHSQVMDQGVTTQSVNDAIASAKELLQKMEVNQQLRDLSYNIIANVIEPNKFINKHKTDEAIEIARNSVEEKQYKKGEKIVGKGERVKLEHIEMLDELGLIKHQKKMIDYKYIIGIVVIVSISFMVIIGYLYYFNPKLLDDRSSLILLALIFILILVVPFSFKQIPSYLIPISAAAMLIAILLDTKLAILVNFILSILIGLLIKGDTNYIYISLLTGTCAAFTVTRTYQRNKLVLAGIIVSAVNALLIISFGLLGTNELRITLTDGLNGVLNGLLSIIIAIGTLPFWEATFNIITPLKLLELSNPNQPLIKKLLLEAPGTYHHSLMVGNLAESAAEAIGGNALLARVGAYYHDIGKLKRPFFFKENQFNDNPHDRMTPNLSTLVITSHTKDGLEMAKEHKVPLVIRDIIKQHHGTTMVAYFYHKAKKEDANQTVKPEDFRYEGPKPQTKEAAVVMLADSIEAAVRSMSERTEGKIEGMVRKIIKDKLDDGQLDMCDLTLKDLDTIAKAFLRVLSGFFHERIEYPEAKVKNDKMVIVESENTSQELVNFEQSRDNH
ncbi:HDIG domain-containing metalloprotein [Petroclostridium sp. X23]|uniref:HD family phosphohydrolase n=1 Tax=Petroclostridium sp. X23 TaxID=3045146 RepID=UPI0024AE69D6|nr:HDIG domain-containing metalloprotein [Petroclostridium sp. X23]WHH59578.1 HDIG domain-containing protein [Petroclostridium sp. X23]